LWRFLFEGLCSAGFPLKASFDPTAKAVSGLDENGGTTLFSISLEGPSSIYFSLPYLTASAIA